MKVKNNNSFLAAAKKTTGNKLLTAVASGETKTPLMPGYKGKNSYLSFLRNFGSEYKTVKQVKLLEANVKKYLDLTNQDTEVADLTTFVDYTVDLQKRGGGTEMFLTSGNKVKADVSPYRLYAMYWADRIIHEHNKRVDDTYKLQEQYPSETMYNPSKIDIAKFNVSTGGLTRITSSDLYYYMEGEYKLHVRSNEKFYVYNPVVDKDKLDLIYNHKAYGSGASDKFENRYDLFLHNLLYSAEEAGWDEAIDLIKWFIENGHGDKLYDIYTSDPEFAIVFEYGDNVDEMSTKQKNFVNVLNENISKLM